MPIYEYRCGNCGRKVSILYRSFSAAEQQSGAQCPRCGSPDLSRLFSRVRVVKGGTVGERDSGDDFGDDEMGSMAGVDDRDPRAIARWARQYQAERGEALEPEMDAALGRIEQGEDPGSVLGDLAASDAGESGGDEDF